MKNLGCPHPGQYSVSDIPGDYGFDAADAGLTSDQTVGAVNAFAAGAPAEQDDDGAAQSALAGAAYAQNIDGDWAYFDASGQLVGYAEVAPDGSVVYTDPDGNVVTGMRSAPGTVLWFDPQGNLYEMDVSATSADAGSQAQTHTQTESADALGGGPARLDRAGDPAGAPQRYGSGGWNLLGDDATSGGSAPPPTTSDATSNGKPVITYDGRQYTVESSYPYSPTSPAEALPAEFDPGMAGAETTASGWDQYSQSSWSVSTLPSGVLVYLDDELGRYFVLRPVPAGGAATQPPPATPPDAQPGPPPLPGPSGGQVVGPRGTQYPAGVEVPPNMSPPSPGALGAPPASAVPPSWYSPSPAVPPPPTNAQMRAQMMRDIELGKLLIAPPAPPSGALFAQGLGEDGEGEEWDDGDAPLDGLPGYPYPGGTDGQGLPSAPGAAPSREDFRHFGALADRPFMRWLLYGTDTPVLDALTSYKNLKLAQDLSAGTAILAGSIATGGALGTGLTGLGYTTVFAGAAGGAGGGTFALGASSLYQGRDPTLEEAVFDIGGGAVGGALGGALVGSGVRPALSGALSGAGAGAFGLGGSSLAGGRDPSAGDVALAIGGGALAGGLAGAAVELGGLSGTRGWGSAEDVRAGAAEGAAEDAGAEQGPLATGARRVFGPTDWGPEVDAAYDEIRSAREDVARIADNTGFSADEIKLVKDHIFNNTHMLDDGVVARFDADPFIANAWQRMIDGTFNANDIALLQHELFELNYENTFQSTYREAHDAAIQAGYVWEWSQ